MYICSCSITKPGISALPFRSIIFPSGGTDAFASSPIQSILPLRIMTVCCGLAGLPLPSIKSAFLKTVTGALKSIYFFVSSLKFTCEKQKFEERQIVIANQNNAFMILFAELLEQLFFLMLSPLTQQPGRLWTFQKSINNFSFNIRQLFS